MANSWCWTASSSDAAERPRRESAVKCPTCDARMKTKTVNSVEVDVCQEHGLWLDKGELERIMSTSRRGYHQIQRSVIRRRVSDARSTGRYEGIFFGWLSLFLPE
ncbi:MAG TPA: zf-TFIIB domain-containing protein [Candidatus Saccharimonadales bacterium]|nr:zf-TFIIB domain-containing protein [Candidatus Saccharimonadales bacterium]